MEEVENPSATGKKSDGKLSQAIKDRVMKEVWNFLRCIIQCFNYFYLFFILKVRLHFRPEFLNRLDDIVFFQPLNIKELSSIVHLQLQSLEERLKEQDIKVNLTDKAVQSALKKSYNPGIL